jgi:hypothetical protein
MATPSSKVAILEKYNPWTYDTLPFTPDPKDGFLSTKKSRPDQVRKTAALRMRQKPKWMKELQKVGVRKIDKANAIKLPKSVSKLPDAALDALKLEFGLGGQKPKPSWRLGFSHLARQGFKSFVKEKKLLAYPLTRPSFNMWKHWPPKTKHAISTLQAQKFKNFQKKVAYKR